mgnify:CR=1 FL=1
MKSVLLSIRPNWCEKIFNGEKTMEVRKTAPNLETPFTVYVYQTKIKFKVKNWQENFHSIVFTPNGGVEEGNGKVIGSFVCDRVRLCIPFGLKGHLLSQEVYREMCLTKEQLDKYGGLKTLYGWHITEPKLFDKPKMVTEFAVYGRCAQECSEYDICMKYDSEETRVECPDFAKAPLKRAPQSWCYVEEI